jgi:hypothetical protein
MEISALDLAGEGWLYIDYANKLEKFQALRK